MSQTATFDFQLKVGTAQQNVTVNAAEGAALETATSELGTVVNTKEVTDLPLNGRNFTQLLTITAGVANINRDQSASGGSGWAGNSLGSFTFPAVNGARNRSNYFILDGENDLNTMLGMYNYSPIVDAIQEFKTQGHNDLAEYGGAAGGIVSVVTKSGTNQFHGALWEFLRNADMDARGYFESTLPPLKQNQYGASVGGPVWIPKVYNGKNRTFFYAAFEGFRIRSAMTTGALAPTAADAQRRFQRPGRTDLRSGDDHSQSGNRYVLAHRVPWRHYPRRPDQSDLGAFPDTHPARLARWLTGTTSIRPGQPQTNQNSGTARGDQNFGNNNQLMFRFSDFDQKVANTTNIVGLNTIHVYGHNYVGHWTHTFSPTAFSDVYFGRNFGVHHHRHRVSRGNSGVSWSVADTRDVEVLDDSEQQAVRTAVDCG